MRIACEKNEATRFRANYGCRLVALSGTVGFEGVMHRVDLLSPLLSGQRPDETLAVRIGYDAHKAKLEVGLAAAAGIGLR